MQKKFILPLEILIKTGVFVYNYEKGHIKKSAQKEKIQKTIDKKSRCAIIVTCE